MTPCCGPGTPRWPSRSTPSMPTRTTSPASTCPPSWWPPPISRRRSAHADLLVVGVPTSGFRAVLEEAAPCMRPWIPVVSLSKGLEKDTTAPDDRGDQGGGPRAPGGRPHRAQHGPRDHVGQGRRLGHRHRGPRGGHGHPGGVHPGRVPRLPQRRRHRLRDGRCAEERHRHRRRHRRGAGGGRQHPGRGDVTRPGRAGPARAWPSVPSRPPSAGWPAWAT